MHSDLLRFKVLMEPIILVFIKLMGAANSGHWDLRDTSHKDYARLGHSCAVSWVAVRVRPWVAVAQKRHFFASRSCLDAKMAVPNDS